jgi:hypothetical protein
MKGEIPEIEIECVKITGRIKGISTKIELIMDKKTFLEWEMKLKEIKKW